MPISPPPHTFPCTHTQIVQDKLKETGKKKKKKGGKDIKKE